jgi:hypothetical protein
MKFTHWFIGCFVVLVLALLGALGHAAVGFYILLALLAAGTATICVGCLLDRIEMLRGDAQLGEQIANQTISRWRESRTKLRLAYQRSRDSLLRDRLALLLLGFGKDRVDDLSAEERNVYAQVIRNWPKTEKAFYETP